MATNGYSSAVTLLQHAVYLGLYSWCGAVHHFIDLPCHCNESWLGPLFDTLTLNMRTSSEHRICCFCCPIPLMYLIDINAWSETGKAVVTCLAVLEMFAGFIQILAAIQFIYAGFTLVGPNIFAYGVSAGVCGIIGGCTSFCSQVCFCTLLCTPNTREEDSGRLL